MNIIFKKSTVYPPPNFISLIRNSVLHSHLPEILCPVPWRKQHNKWSERLALPWLLRELYYPPRSSSKVNSFGLESYSLTNVRAKPKKLLSRIKHGQYLITDSPHLVFCSLTLPGILLYSEYTSFSSSAYFRWLDSKQCFVYKQHNIFPKHRLYQHIK